MCYPKHVKRSLHRGIKQLAFGIINAINDAGRSEMEDTSGAAEGGNDGGRIEEIELE